MASRSKASPAAMPRVMPTRTACSASRGAGMSSGTRCRRVRSAPRKRSQRPAGVDSSRRCRQAAKRQTVFRPLALLAGAFDQRVHCFLGPRFGRHVIRQTPAERFGSLQPACAQDHSQSRLQSDDARQPLRSAPARQQTEFQLGQAELRFGMVDRQPIIAGKGEFQTAAQAGTVDHRDGRHW